MIFCNLLQMFFHQLFNLRGESLNGWLSKKVRQGQLDVEFLTETANDPHRGEGMSSHLKKIVSDGHFAEFQN